MKDRTLNDHMKESLLLKEKIDALQKEKDKHDDAIKAELVRRGETAYEHGGHKASYTEVMQMRFDKAAFEAEHPNEYDKYRTKKCISMRYHIA